MPRNKPSGVTLKRQRPQQDPMREARKGPGVRRHRTGLRDRLESYRSHHRQVGRDSLGRLLKQPFTTMMTALVLAVAMALPMGLYVALNNIEAVSQGWEGAARLSMFLKFDVDANAAQRLRQEIVRRDEVAAAEYISPEEALVEFRERSGFGDVLDELDSNPLPGLIVITPQQAYSSPEKIALLRTSLAAMPQVDQLKLDMEWLQRLNRITELSRRMTVALAAMLALGVLLIVGNTIKLAIENRREEIVVVKLVGGTNAFVRRPFLYTGFWYGLTGGVLAWVLVEACLMWLKGPVAELSALYHSQFQLTGLGVLDSILVLIIASGLGLLGAVLVVGRELAAIEPQ